MSPDRTTITRAEAIRRRKEEEQQRREKLTHKRAVTPKPAPAPKPAARPRAEHAPRSLPSVTPRLRRRYDVAVTNSAYGRGSSSARQGQAPSISLPRIQFGPRWFSTLLVMACVFSIYFFFTDPTFLVRDVTIQGNSRIGSADINAVLGIANQSSALLNPAQIEYNILAAFPDISAASVQVNLPAEVLVTVQERQPLAAWQQDGQMVWLDAQGYAFPPRGVLEGLVTVSANGAPPAPQEVDPTQLVGARPFLGHDLAAAIAILSPNLPEGATLIYDPKYGLGWIDPRGWQVYFGHSDGDMSIKFQVYQSMVDYLTQRNVQPTLISVEYPDAPFYRVEQ